MVKIIDYKERETKEGDNFFSLIVQGDVEFVKSQQSGKFYATARKAYIACTFNEATCAALVGTEMPGSIEKESCEPYEYVNQDTGEVLMLTHTYVYNPDENPSNSAKPANFANIAEIASPQVNPVKADKEQFSENGVAEFA